MQRNAKIGIAVALLLILGVVAFSFLFPQKLTLVDKLRLVVQGGVMSTVGEYTQGDFSIDNQTPIAGPQDITLEELDPFLRMLQPGDVLFTNSPRYVSSAFIPGKWKHSAIYLGTREELKERFGNESRAYQVFAAYYTNESQRMVLDASARGVTVHDIDELSNLHTLSYLQSLVAFRPNADDGQIEQYLLSAASHIGKQYDYDMITDDQESLYCSELVFDSLRTINITLTRRSNVMISREIISPDDMVREMASREEFTFLFFIEKRAEAIITHPVALLG